MAKAITDAILEGEAHALGMRGSSGKPTEVYRILVEKIKGASDIAERVARSFGGSVGDKFVKARLHGIHRRVVASALRPTPRRGFDALVDVLYQMLEAQKEGDIEREIARAIHADSDDQVVRALAVRIAALRKGV